MTIRVAVLTEDPDGPSARHRWAWPAKHLAEHGIEVALHAVEPRDRRPLAFAAAARADITVVHRKMFRARDLRRLRSGLRGRMVYDLDDAVMYRPSGRRRQRSLLRTLRFVRMVRLSSLFIAGNDYLKSRGPRRVPCVVVPTPVEMSRYEVRTEWPDRGRVIGWIGAQSTLPYLLEIAPVLDALTEERSDLVLRIIGPDPTPFRPRIPRVRIEHVPWTLAGEAAAVSGIDVGILPLPDDLWTRGKCAFKALQYMAAGLPVVASPIGMNTQVVTPGETGFLPRGFEEWKEALTSLLDDRELRRETGAAGRRRVEERYATAVVASRVARVLEGLA